MRNIAVVSGARSDYGLLRPVLRAIQQSPDLNLRLIVSGSHFMVSLGRTVDEIRADGFVDFDRVDLPLTNDDAQGIANAMGIALSSFAALFHERRPDLLLVLGDRYEVFCAAAAAAIANIPIAHIHGGELSQGAIDDSLRHAITKLSHLHFTACEEYANRVKQLGEEPWRVIVSGSPAIDNLKEISLRNSAELELDLGISLTPKPFLITFHPATLEPNSSGNQIRELLEALSEWEEPLIFTAPNADTGHQAIQAAITEFIERRSCAYYFPHLGSTRYLSLMAQAQVMIGNSSSGLIEAPFFKLPVVNVGKRQAGRVRAENVIDTGCRREDIASGIRRALSPEFRSSLDSCVSPYGSGHASQLIVARLSEQALDNALLLKVFQDLGLSGPA